MTGWSDHLSATNCHPFTKEPISTLNILYTYELVVRAIASLWFPECEL